MIQHPSSESLISISLAEARHYGLAEAVVLAQLKSAGQWLPPGYYQGQTWYEIIAGKLLDQLPLAGLAELNGALQNLINHGVIYTGTLPASNDALLQFSLVNNIPATAAAPQRLPVVTMPQNSVPQNSVPQNNLPQNNVPQNLGDGIMTAHWQPTRETLARIQQLGISPAFIEEQLPEFITFWRSSGEQHRSWDAKFHQHVVRKWRERETFVARQKQEVQIDKSWRPSQDALEILTQHSGVPESFVEDAVPEFILYWSEKGTRSGTWNKFFCDHVKRQWARYQSAIKYDTEPTRIPRIGDRMPMHSIFCGWRILM